MALTCFDFINKGDVRSVQVKRNIFYSLLLKGCSVGISLLLVPLTLYYLDSTNYGIWLTLSSILTWINLFDIGLGNGLRNKLTEALTCQNLKLAQTYVSTTVALLVLIMGGFFLLFMVINPYLDWSTILNTESSRANSLNHLVIVVFAFFCLQFIFKFIGVVLLADQKPAMNDFLGVLGSVLSLAIIFILTKTTVGSLNYIALTYSAAPIFILCIAYPLLFLGRYKALKPKFSLVDFRYTKDLMGLGVQFFILQISGLVVFTTTNVIITQLFGPEEVTPYNIVFKYFSIVTLGFNIVLTPMWSAYTQAYCRQDLQWMRRATARMVQMWGGGLLLTFVMILCAKQIYVWWVGESVIIPFELTILVGVYVTVFNWNNIFAQMLAGVGKIRLSLFNSIFNAIIFIPLALWLGRTIGIFGIVLATLIVLLTSSFWQPIQCMKILNNKAKGIWNR